ncbi:3,4-dihydroxy 2-butanone 4-phosphate synthase [Chitinivorax tropicus]|uniref:3,4-dihydroxy-2-butanone 4-phosphate synthase n=1 Tax=Chitinivorax tropicus TaxID=714531 RepID=A0A840MFX2_9PROT|nr:3,4-dihydroxy-2-butanone-4-phosphate synthase [Chitinivorax tropicus]MBB5017300.1 3,4-dihydroxy 2-butanone 4-phosphate synthase [Chitinivorax tropicus]
MNFLPTHFEQRVNAALAAIKAGVPVVLTDDLDRENEADLIIAADRITEASMAQLIRDCSGIVCLCLTEERIRHLNLPPMASRNQSRYGTAFTVSIEARYNTTTGVSAADRVTTVRAAIAPDAKPDDLISPGHMFPLQAAPGGVLTRRGHTEGSVDLAMLAGLSPAAVLCELMNPDGTMMRGDALWAYATKHQLPILSVEDIVQYRQARQFAA